jgi:hypothetical protein
MAKAHTLGDEFTDNTTDAVKWTISGIPALDTERIREVNQRLEIRPRPLQASAWLQYYRSASRFDLTESEVRVELVQALTAELNTTTFLTATKDSPNEAIIAVESGILRAVQEVAGVTTILEQVWYDPAIHRWLRMRERSGKLFYEYSSNGSDFIVFAQTTSPTFLNDVTLNIGAGTYAAVASPGFAAFDNFNWAHTRPPERRVEERRLAARAVREQVAALASSREYDEHHNNNDEVSYSTRPYVGNYSKSLQHDTLGDPVPFSYGSLLRALESRDPADFDEIQLASATALKLTNPQSGFAFELSGPDPQERTMPPAPRFDSRVTAHEMGELYWMALARDVPFFQWESDAGTPTTIIARAIESLNSEFMEYGGPSPVTAKTLFRGVYPGEQIGPYVSQFLLKGNVDNRPAARDATAGDITYGTQVIPQRNLVAQTGVDHLTTVVDWLAVQNGADHRGLDSFDGVRRYLYTLRAGATYVHFDQVINAFYNAAHYLLTEPTGNQLNYISGTTGRPMVDLEFLNNDGNPYNPPGTSRDSKTQAGFATFGPIHLFQVLSEVLGRALRAVWWQKWGVHRRLRPEEYGGRVHNHISGLRTYSLHADIINSLSTGDLSGFFGPGDQFSTYLLPQAYPEGAPTHPAYGAGHATGSAACATILKAFFDDDQVIENPVQPSLSGTSLVTYTPPVGEPALTVNGEMNKLTGNIALFRNAAGVHWRSDYTESVLLGEDVAMGLLQEMSLLFNEENAFFQFTRLDGTIVRIENGEIQKFR